MKRYNFLGGIYPVVYAEFKEHEENINILESITT